MSKEIIVTPELLEQRSNECKSYASDVDAILKKLRSLAKALEAEWKGKASEEFLSQFNGTVLPNFEKAIQLLDAKDTGASAQLKKKADDFRTADGNK